MRYTHKDKQYPERGDTREISYFAILPVTIDGETRWFEKVKIKQTYCYSMGSLEDGDTYYWSNDKFID